MAKGKKANGSWDINDFLDEANIETADLGETCEEYSKLFGANKNLYRVFPSMNDGCKPVQRRLLYSTYMSDKGDHSKFRKMGIIASNCMNYHPHGDASISDVAANLAQPWTNNVCYFEGHGNFGSMRGDEAGAGRYIEARLSKYALKCFFEDFKDANVDMKDTYGGDLQEPEFLPARYPTALFNLQLSGIGYGFASNIPPFNVAEVMEATIKLIKDPNAKIFLVPDSPTGCNIIDNGYLKEINEKGTGKMVMEATYDIDYVNNVITITSLPPQITSMMVIDRIIEAVDGKKIDFIKDIQDHTASGTVFLEIFLTKDADPDKAIKTLLKKNTGIRMTYPVALKMIDDYKDYDYSVRSFLEAWIEFRREIVRSMYNTRLVRQMEEQHMNDVLLMVTEGKNAEKTVTLVKNAKNTAEAEKALMNTYGITSLQAETIARMRISQLTKEAHENYKAKKKSLKEDIANTEEILDNPQKIDEVIIEQLEEGIKLFGRPRQSKLIKTKSAEAELPNTTYLVGISKDGYIKKLEYPAYASIGPVGKTPKQQIIVNSVNNRSSLLLFDSTGMVTRIQVSTIPDSKYDEPGLQMNRYFKTNGTIVGLLEDRTITPDYDVIMITKNGWGKKTGWEEFDAIKDSKVAMVIDSTDELVSVIAAKKATKKNIIIYTNKGNGTRLDIKEMKSLKRKSKGTLQLTLSSNEAVVGIDVMEPKKKYLVYITSSGKMKLTETKYFPQMKQKDETVSLLPLYNNESLVGIASVSLDDSIVIYRKTSDPITIPMSEVSLSTRVAKPEKKVKTLKGDYVISFLVLTK